MVVELKRGDGSHMELQAIRYCAMISGMGFDQAVKAYEEYMEKYQIADKINAREELVEFMNQIGEDEQVEKVFGNKVRVILVSETFSTEIKTTVVWLNAQGLHISCVKLNPYKLEGKSLIDVEEIIPIKEYDLIKVAIREDVKKNTNSTRDFAKFNLHFDPPFEFQECLNLPKNRVVLRTVQYLVDKGIGPEELETATPLKIKFICVKLDKNSEEFDEIYEKEAAKDIKRYFLEQKDLLEFNNKIYALSNGWAGRDELENLVKHLNEKYTKYDIQLKAVESED